jgi:hypothetical protein
MTASSPASVQGQPAGIVTATTQTPKAMIPAEIKNENSNHDCLLSNAAGIAAHPGRGPPWSIFVPGA